MKYALLHPKTRQLLQKSHQGTWTLIPFFFSDRGSSIQKNVDGLLQELLYQVLCHYQELVELVISISLRSVYSEFSTTRFTFDDRDPERIIWNRKSIQDARKLIKDDADLQDVKRLCSPEVIRKSLDAITRQKEVQMNIVFFIDALDEHHGSHRELVDILRGLSNSNNSATVRIKLCLASRHESVFPGAFSKYPGFAIHDHTYSDIKQYAFDRVESSFDLSIVSEDDRNQIKPLTTEVTERAKGVFVWVKLVVDELIQGIDDGNSISQMRRSLSSIPTGLDALYKRILQKRRPEHLLEFYVMAQILLCSLDPVSLRSLMAITDVALPGDVVETMSISRMRQRLASRCGGLVEIYEESLDGQNTGKNQQEYSDKQKLTPETAEIGKISSAPENNNNGESGNDHDELSVKKGEPEVSPDDSSSMHNLGISRPEKEYITELIDNEIAESHDEGGKVYRVQFLHQTVKTFLETPANIRSMFEDPKQCPTEIGYSYIFNFCVKAMTIMKFDQALIHRTVIQRLFSYARLLEQSMRIEFADLLDLLLIEHRHWFPERFEMAVCCGEEKRVWDHCVHWIPHNGLRTDGLNLWQICAHGDRRSSRGFSLLRCRALPIYPSTRAFDLLLLTAFYGLSYYVERKVLEGAPMVCPKSNRSLLWAAVDYCQRCRSTSSFYEGLKMVDFLIQRKPDMETPYCRLTPLALTIYETGRRGSLLKSINPLLLIRKLLCGGADAEAFIWDFKALSHTIDVYHFTTDYEQGNEMVELLLKHGANPRSPCRLRWEPLFWSIKWGNVTCTETLLRYGADPSCVGNNISALELPTSEDELPWRLTSDYERGEWRTFHDYAVEMHDMLVKYKNPARTAPLCECKQKITVAD